MDTSESHQAPTVERERWSRRTIGLLSVLYLLLGLALFSWLARVENEEIPTGNSCNNNLKQLGLIVRMYANDHGDMFPEVSLRPGALALRQDQDYPGVYPEYLTDLTILRCPNLNTERPRYRWFWEAPPPSPAPLDSASNDESYLYLGYVIPNQETLERFAEAYRAHIASGKIFDKDLNITNDVGDPLQIPRLRVGIPGITDSKEEQYTIPVFVERFPKGHIPGGAYVAFLDGHVEWIKWGERWPMTPEAMEVLLALDELGQD
jgi:prepilin-type processing-associated H-X9-DG protein